MPQPKVLEVTLSEQSLDFVRDKLASGEYRSASELLDYSLRSIMEDEQELGRFEQEEVIPAYQESLANPMSAIPIDEVRRNLKDAFESRYRAG